MWEPANFGKYPHLHIGCELLPKLAHACYELAAWAPCVTPEVSVQYLPIMWKGLARESSNEWEVYYSDCVI